MYSFLPPKHKFNNPRRNSGYTLLFAVVISGIITVIGYSIVNIIRKETVLSSISRESQSAFYAADAGLECALFWDIEHPNFGSSIFSQESGWDVTNIILPGVFENLGNVTGNSNDDPRHMFFKPTGDRMFVVDRGNQRVYQYDLSVPWDVTSVVQPLVFKDISGGIIWNSNIRGIFFKPTGDRLFVVDLDDRGVYQYSLSDPWSVTSIVLPGVFKGLGTVSGNQNDNPYGIFFKPTGDRMFISDNGDRGVYQYTLSVPWDINNVVQPPVFEGLGTVSGNANDDPRNIFFKPEGDRMFVLDNDNDRVYQYDLSVPWDVTSVVQPPVFKDISGGTNNDNPVGIFFKPTGDRMFISDNSSDDDDRGVYQYTIEVEHLPVNQNTPNIFCNEANITDSPDWEDIEEDDDIIVVPFEMDFPDGSCARVTVEKNIQSNQTIIESRGYNTCDANSPRRVERAFVANY